MNADLLRCHRVMLATFFIAIPAAVGTRLDNTSLEIAVGLRLGSNICVRRRYACAMSIEQVNAAGTHHGLACRKSAGRHFRHSV